MYCCVLCIMYCCVLCVVGYIVTPIIVRPRSRAGTSQDCHLLTLGLTLSYAKTGQNLDLKVHNVFPKVTVPPWLHPVKIQGRI